MDKKKKTTLMIIILLIIIVLSIAGTTYAWYVWRSTDDQKTTIVTGVGAATVYYDGGASIIGAEIRPVSDRYNGIVKNIKIKTDYTGMQTFDLYLDIEVLDEELKHESFRFAAYNGTTLIKEGNFSNEYLSAEGNTSDCPVNTGLKHVQLFSNQSVTKTTTTYTVYIWIDGANYTNPTEMQNKNFSFNLHASGKDAILIEAEMPDIAETVDGTLAYNIVSSYNRAKKTAVTNNSIVYNYDYENNLMSDIDGNVRYFGAEPNNYIYFNCSDYSNQSSETCEKWRIIGVFAGKVKIVKNTEFSSLAWDYGKNDVPSSDTESNDWHNSSLKTFLNEKYYNGDTAGTVTYHSSYGSGNYDDKSFDMSIVGIKNESTRNLISEVPWSLGTAGTNSGIYSNQMYEYEKGDLKCTNCTYNTIWYGKIALPYASDYGYAADFSSCTTYLSNYSTETCTSTNWMKNSFGNNYVYLLTPSRFSSDPTYVWTVYSSGSVSDWLVVGRYSYYTWYPASILPTVYLSADVNVNSGNGSREMPYQISIE